MPQEASETRDLRSARAPNHGERVRAQILDRAVDVASAEGLAGLSIGRLAASAGISKSGLFAHFGSKQMLQMATVERAARAFEEGISEPEHLEPGLERLAHKVEAWLRYVERSPLRGGCFFAATSSEFGSRPGTVRDRLATLTRAWLRSLEREAGTAVRQAELRADTDPAQLAFELHAYVQEANWTRELFDDSQAFARARRAVRRALKNASVEGTPENRGGAAPRGKADRRRRRRARRRTGSS